MEDIKITIVTATYNAEKTLEQSILSIVHQDYPNIEYIIVDGGSTDRTINILKQYEHYGIKWISEPDYGIYDGLNKGIQLATGDYLYFLGADDWLCNNEVMREVSCFINTHPGFSFYAGNVFLYRSTYRLIKRKRADLSIEEIKKGGMCPHQGLFSSRRLMLKGFDITYRLAADYELFLRNIVRGESYCVMDVDVAYYSLFGASADFSLYDEYIAIIKKHAGEGYLDRIYKLKENNTDKYCFRRFIKRILVALLSEKFFWRCRGWKNFDGTGSRG